jgi:RNA polymerase sigma-70 factor (ECF subfamily)
MSRQDLIQLVQRAQAGDRSAYGQLVEQFQSQVYALALAWMHDVAEAQELSQEVFLRALVKLRQLRAPECFAAWLQRLARRLAYNRRRRRLPATASNDLLPQLPAADRGPLEELLRAEVRDAIREGLHHLRAADREVLLAFYFEGHSVQHISQKLGVPVGTVKRRLHVARHRLQRQLARRTPAMV